MNKNKISQLFQRFIEAQKKGNEPYFDASEVEELLESLEVANDYTYYDEILSLGLKLHPDNVDLKIKQCRSYLYYEEYEQALKYVRTLTESNNEELDILRLECLCYNNLYSDVKNLTIDLIAKKCDYTRNLFVYISSTLNELGLYKECQDYISLALKYFPDDLTIKDELCYSLEMAGDIAAAITICNEMIDTNPYSFDFWLNIGHLYSLDEQYEKAIDAFDFALACDGKRVDEVNLMKGYCLYMNESYEEAIKIYENVKISDSLVIQHVKPVLAECYIRVQDFEKAYPLLKDYLEDYGRFDDPDCYLHYFFCCIELHRDQEGMNILLKGIKAHPDNLRILSLLIIAFLQKKDNRKAQLMMNRMIEILNRQENEDEDGEEIIENAELNSMHFTQGDLSTAFKHFNKILEQYPDVPFTDMLSTLFYLNKKDIPLSDIDTAQMPLFTTTLSRKKEYYITKAEHLDTKQSMSEFLMTDYLNNKNNFN